MPYLRKRTMHERTLTRGALGAGLWLSIAAVGCSANDSSPEPGAPDGSGSPTHATSSCPADLVTWGLGEDVASVGDFDGDGENEFMVSNAGEGFLVFPNREGRTLELEYDAGDPLSEEDAWVMGTRALGASAQLSAAGDFNGDGFDDFVIGVGSSGGYVSVGLGAPRRDEVVFLGARTEGATVASGAGAGVGGGADVNGDGLDDLVIGAPDPGAFELPGRAYVVFGNRSEEAFSLREVARGEGGFSIEGGRRRGRFGSSVALVDDINGDGRAEVAVGSANDGPGTVAVVWGRADGDEVSTTSGGFGGFVVEGQVDTTGTGSAVRSVGDVNGDGLGDILIGQIRNGPDGNRRSFVVFGQTAAERILLADVAAGVGGFMMESPSPFPGSTRASGHVIAGVGDINGDALADFAIGEPAEEDDVGAVYVVYGKNDGAKVALANLEAEGAGLVLRGVDPGQRFGWSLSGYSDLDGDGLRDLVVGGSSESTKKRADVLFSCNHF